MLCACLMVLRFLPSRATNEEPADMSWAETAAEDEAHEPEFEPQLTSLDVATVAET